jgi:hypothetical protein
VTAAAAVATAAAIPLWQTFKSAGYNDVVSYPADWTIDVQTSVPGRDPEYVYLRSGANTLPVVSMSSDGEWG